jgi:hypothetical protein
MDVSHQTTIAMRRVGCITTATPRYRQPLTVRALKANRTTLTPWLDWLPIDAVTLSAIRTRVIVPRKPVPLTWTIPPYKEGMTMPGIPHDRGELRSRPKKEDHLFIQE